MRQILSFALVALAACPAWAGDKCPDFRFRSVRSLSVRDIGRLTEPDTDSKQISVRWFDEEDRPWLGKRPAIAFLLARTGDLAEKPIAGILYSDAPMRLETNQHPDTAYATATFVSKGSESSCQKFVFSLQPNGRVTANGAFIGQVK